MFVCMVQQGKEFQTLALGNQHFLLQGNAFNPPSMLSLPWEKMVASFLGAIVASIIWWQAPGGNCVWFPFFQWVPWFFGRSFEGRNGVTGLLFHKCLGEKWDECQSWLHTSFFGPSLGPLTWHVRRITRLLPWYFAYIYNIRIYIYICIIYIDYLWLIKHPLRNKALWPWLLNS